MGFLHISKCKDVYRMGNEESPYTSCINNDIYHNLLIQGVYLLV